MRTRAQCQCAMVLTDLSPLLTAACRAKNHAIANAHRTCGRSLLQDAEVRESFVPSFRYHTCSHSVDRASGMNIIDSTRRYEEWLAASVTSGLEQSDLNFKHERMADPVDPFPFFRATYYRWTQIWNGSAGVLEDAPRVLSVGDLHIENFGTWRDADGRLCWGVNDFDEADELPYTHDLARLAVSVRLAKRTGLIEVSFGDACRAILDGYQKSLEAGGKPFVLEEHHSDLRALAMSAEREPAAFWRKMTKLLDDPTPEVPSSAMHALQSSLPANELTYQVRRRPRVGMGSLGRSRFAALAEWNGGWIAREVKAVAPPATAWNASRSSPQRITDAVSKANRSPDPYYRLQEGWIVRRLAPRCSRIELSELARSDVQALLHAMGAEVANVHLGACQTSDLLANLTRQPDHWLADVARIVSDALQADWHEWQSSFRHS